MASPTQKALKYYKDLGYTCAIVEKWNPHAMIRQDLFGFIDIIAIGEGKTIGVQCTSKSGVSSRVKKVLEHENLPAVLQAGWEVEVVGFEKGSTTPVIRKIGEQYEH